MLKRLAGRCERVVLRIGFLLEDAQRRELVLDLGAILPVSGSWVLILGVIAAMGLLTLMLRLARRAT